MNFIRTKQKFPMTKNTPPNFIFFGTPSVARDTLAFLVENGFSPTAVVTNPDRPRGRGLTLTPSETGAWARARGIPVLTPSVLDAEAIAACACGAGAGGDTNGADADGGKGEDSGGSIVTPADLAIVVAYGKIFPQTLIDAFPKGVINVHYSLLPKYRGAAPVEAAILNDDKTTGVSIQKMTLALDAGDILAAQSTPIHPDETARDLRARLTTLGAELLTKLLPAISQGTLGVAQDETKATYAPKIKKEDGRVFLGSDAHENWNKYRAYFEWPGTYFFAARPPKKIRVKITRARFARGAFIIERVIPEGKREQPYDRFMSTGWVAE
mgnify:CR=1 FL=1